MKQELRKQKLRERMSLSAQEYGAMSAAVCENLACVGRITNARRIMAYYPCRNEPDILPFVNRCLEKGIKIAMPFVTGDGEMKAVSFETGCATRKNRFGIPEPHGTCGIEPEDIDVVLVPGAAFGRNGERVGSGRGYYDRFLSGMDAFKAGVCFDFQIAGDIGGEEHDVGMDVVVTDKRVIGETR